MKKDLFFPAIIAGAIVIVVALFVILVNQGKEKINEDLIFFYSPTCPHCQKVEEFFIANRVSDLISFSEIDVTESPAVSNLFAEKNAACNIAQKDVGVPMLWNDGECLVGDVDIINFFKEKTGI